MKKLLYLLSLTFICIFLSSCYDMRIAKINGIVWKDDYFGIVVTSDQLQHKDDAGYATIVFNEKEYNCNVELVNNCFLATIYDNTLSETGKYNFLDGNYENGDLIKEKNKAYKYSLIITLKTNCEYYNYCIENNIEFQKTITLYGYEA